MVALLGGSLWVQALVIRRAPASRKAFWPAPAREFGF